MFNLPDMRPLIWMAGFGLLCAAALILVGVPAGLWWLFHHVKFI